MAREDKQKEMTRDMHETNQQDIVDTATETQPAVIPTSVPRPSSKNTPIILSVPAFVNTDLLSLGLDSGASVCLLRDSALQALRDLNPTFTFTVNQPDKQLASVDGAKLPVTGTISLPIAFARDAPTLRITFYITSHLALPCDGLLGLDAMLVHGITFNPGRGHITCKGRKFPVLDESRSFLSPSPTAIPLLSASAILIGNHLLPPSSVVRLPVRLSDLPTGSTVMSSPSTMKVKRLALESTLSTVSDDHRSVALVTNPTGASVHLKNGVNLGSFETLDPPCLSDVVTLPVSSVTPSDSTCVDLPSTVESLSSFLKTSASAKDRTSLLQLLARHRQAIALPGETMGRTDTISHRIALQPGSNPAYTPSYRLPHSHREKAQEMVDDLLCKGIIQESHSPWNSPLFLVPKKDGTLRPVVDFRKVNALTEPDHYPLPVLGDLLQSIGAGNTVFSSLDLLNGFWQIPMDPDSRAVTAFSTPCGHYEWLRLPFGLRNAPLTFQRMVNTLFAGMIGHGLFVYLDDIIIVSKDMDSHLRQLDTVFTRLSEAGLKVKLSKCDFLKPRITFLGHVVDESGIHTSDDKVSAVRNFPVPRNSDHVRSFLGLAGYYRPFIQGFASIASPLTRLLKKDVTFTWEEAHQAAFDHLKEALTKAPVLSFPDYTLPFAIYTDASSHGVGAVLMQQAESSRPRVIAYASRVLNSAESKYSVTHQEALAVIWALKHWRDIIFGYRIVVHTDHLPVTQLFKVKNLSGRLARWFLTIQEFAPEFKYVPGKANTVADALSRHIPVAVVTAISNYSPSELAEAQRSDPFWSRVIQALERDDESLLPPSMPLPFSSFLLRGDILCHAQTSTGGTTTQLVIPQALVPSTLRLIHDSPVAGHPGRDRTLTMARAKYYWPGMRKDVESHVAHCVSCARTKGHTTTAPLLNYPLPNCPFDVVGIDILQLPKSRLGSCYVLVCVDHFSRFTILAPLPDKSASSVALALVNTLICPYTTPRILLSDNGLEFKNQILKGVCERFGITQTFIAAYHPAANGLVERTNKKILDILRHLSSTLQESWEDWLPLVAASINGIPNPSTGKDPHSILFGFHKHLPFDVVTDLPSSQPSMDAYYQTQQQYFDTIHTTVRNHLLESRAEMARRQHARATPISISLGDSVMLRAPARSCKLSPKFSGPFLVTALAPGNKFHILDPVSNNEDIVHADRLKKTSASLPEPNPPDAVPPPSTPNLTPPSVYSFSFPSQSPQHSSLQNTTDPLGSSSLFLPSSASTPAGFSPLSSNTAHSQPDVPSDSLLPAHSPPSAPQLPIHPYNLRPRNKHPCDVNCRFCSSLFSYTCETPL